MMKKNTFALGLVAIALSGFVGCGESKPAPSTSAKKPAVPSSTPAADNSADTTATAASETAAEGGWGGLTGRFVVTGAAPTPAKIDVTKDQEVCGKHNLVKENVVVSESGGLANVVIYVRTKDVKIHPDLEAVPAEPVVLDNKNCRFEPHVLLARAGQKISLKNSDPVGHNTKADLITNAAFNYLLPAGGEQEVLLASAERMPVPVGCNIHPWMQGYLYLGANPYMAVTDSDGKFTIENLPSGELEFQLWHESVGYLSGVNLQGMEAKKGRVDLAIQPDDTNDLGEIQVDASLLK